MNWAEQAANSHYQTAVAIRDRLHDGDVEDAERGIQELIDALSRAERRALRSQLVRLMSHIIKWKLQPEKRSRSWVLTILSARREIEDIQEETPSLTNEVIQSLWPAAWKWARDEAEAEMGIKADLSPATWDEVFKEKYKL